MLEWQRKAKEAKLAKKRAAGEASGDEDDEDADEARARKRELRRVQGEDVSSGKVSCLCEVTRLPAPVHPADTLLGFPVSVHRPAPPRCQTDDDGQQLTAFNLQEERQDGYFAETGDFVWHKTKAEDTDAWLDSLKDSEPVADTVRPPPCSRTHVRGASLHLTWWWRVVVAARVRVQTKKDADESDSEEEEQAVDMVAMQRVVLRHLRPGETAVAALQRLGGKAKAPKTKRARGGIVGLGVQPEEVKTLTVKKLKRVLNSLSVQYHNVVEMDELRRLAVEVRRLVLERWSVFGVEAHCEPRTRWCTTLQGLNKEANRAAEEAATLAAQKDPRAFNELTDAVDVLVRNGMPDIYEITYEKLKRKLDAQPGETPPPPFAWGALVCLDPHHAVLCWLVWFHPVAATMTAAAAARAAAAAELAAERAAEQAAAAGNGASAGAGAGAQQPTGQEAKWMYKWTQDAAEEFGPYTTSEMAAWQQQVRFQCPMVVVVRATRVWQGAN